jgi:hypothetical protein
MVDKVSMNQNGLGSHLKKFKCFPKTNGKALCHFKEKNGMILFLDTYLAQYEKELERKNTEEGIPLLKY